MVRPVVVTGTALLLVVTGMTAAHAALGITRAQLNGGQLRLEGGGAVPNHAITVDGVALGSSDAGGAFRIQSSPFSSATCKVAVSDGSTSLTTTLSGCTPAAPPPPSPPSPPPPPPAGGITAPTPLTPANAASVVLPTTLSWSAATAPAGVVAYNWEISPAASFAPVIKLDSTSGQTQSTLSGLAPGTYFWHVQAVDASITQGPWSASKTFTVTGSGPGAPSAPVLSPPNGGTQFHPWECVGIHWTSVAGAATYVLDAATNPSFPVVSSVHINNIPNPAYTLCLVDEGQWNVHIYAVDANGVASPPSNTVSYSVLFTNPVPPPPTPLSPISGETLLLPITLSWTEMANPQPSGYEVQVSSSPTFATIEQDYVQINNSPWVVPSLLAGPKFWRVRSGQGMKSPLLPAFTNWSTPGTFTVSSAPAAVASMVIVNTAPSSGDVVAGQLQLTGPAPAGGASILLSSSDPTVASVPASVPIRAGDALPVTDPAFWLTAGQVSVPTRVTVTATLGSSSKAVDLIVQPSSLKQLWSPSTITGGVLTSGIVYLNGLAPATGAVVSITSSSPAITAPPTVTVLPGSPTLSFAMPTTAVAVDTPVTIRATWNGVSVQTLVTLTPQLPPTSITLSPSSIAASSSTTGVVTLAGPAPRDIQLPLVSSDPSIASTNAFVTISQFGTAASFLVTSRTNVTAPTPVTISVTGAGVTVSAVLTINPLDTGPLPAPQLQSPASAARATAGQPVAFSWTPVANAASYQLQVNTSSAFTGQSVLDRTVSGSSLSASLPAKATVWWRVRAISASGTPGAWSAGRRLDVR